jgi:hypothetical protein
MENTMAVQYCTKEAGKIESVGLVLIRRTLETSERAPRQS